MLNKIFKAVIIGFLPLLVCMIFSSCEKNKDTIAVIIVETIEGNSVPGATVVLHQDGLYNSSTGLPTNSSLRKTDITDSNGRAEFTYNLPAVLKVEVTKIDGNDTLTNKLNNVVLLKEKTTTKIITIN